MIAPGGVPRAALPGARVPERRSRVARRLHTSCGVRLESGIAFSQRDRGHRHDRDDRSCPGLPNTCSIRSAAAAVLRARPMGVNPRRGTPQFTSRWSTGHERHAEDQRAPHAVLFIAHLSGQRGGVSFTSHRTRGGRAGARRRPPLIAPAEDQSRIAARRRSHRGGDPAAPAATTASIPQITAAISTRFARRCRRMGNRAAP